MTIITIDELEEGDVVVVQTTNDSVELHKVLEIDPEGCSIVSEQSEPMDVYVGCMGIVVLDNED